MYDICRLTVSQKIKGEIIMARIIKKYDERRTEFLNTAQELFFTKGYEQTAVETIIKKMGLSKGTFYYYFKSKEDLLDALIKRLSEKILEEVKKIVDREDLDAITKLNRAYAVTRSVKLENLELLKVLLKVLYDDKNILFRFKIYRSSLEILAPEFSKIIRQGIKEKAFNTPYPDEAARLIFEIAYTFSERIPNLILGSDKNPKNLDKAEKEFRVYENAIERIIGAEEGTVKIINRNILNYFHEKINI
jgi:AcrR family transcriptional regulator